MIYECTFKSQIVIGCNNLVWFLCPIYGSWEEISRKRSFMLESTPREDEEVCQLCFEMYSCQNLSVFFLHTSLCWMAIMVISLQWLNTMGLVFLASIFF